MLSPKYAEASRSSNNALYRVLGDSIALCWSTSTPYSSFLGRLFTPPSSAPNLYKSASDDDHRNDWEKVSQSEWNYHINDPFGYLSHDQYRTDEDATNFYWNRESQLMIFLPNVALDYVDDLTRLQAYHDREFIGADPRKEVEKLIFKIQDTANCSIQKSANMSSFGLSARGRGNEKKPFGECYKPSPQSYLYTQAIASECIPGLNSLLALPYRSRYVGRYRGNCRVFHLRTSMRLVGVKKNNHRRCTYLTFESPVITESYHNILSLKLTPDESVKGALETKHTVSDLVTTHDCSLLLAVRSDYLKQHLEQLPEENDDLLPTTIIVSQRSRLDYSRVLFCSRRGFLPRLKEILSRELYTDLKWLREPPNPPEFLNQYWDHAALKHGLQEVHLPSMNQREVGDTRAQPTHDPTSILSGLADNMKDFWMFDDMKCSIDLLCDLLSQGESLATFLDALPPRVSRQVFLYLPRDLLVDVETNLPTTNSSTSPRHLSKVLPCDLFSTNYKESSQFGGDSVHMSDTSSSTSGVTAAGGASVPPRSASSVQFTPEQLGQQPCCHSGFWCRGGDGDLLGDSVDEERIVGSPRGYPVIFSHDDMTSTSSGHSAQLDLRFEPLWTCPMGQLMDNVKNRNRPAFWNGEEGLKNNAVHRMDDFLRVDKDEGVVYLSPSNASPYSANSDQQSSQLETLYHYLENLPGRRTALLEAERHALGLFTEIDDRSAVKGLTVALPDMVANWNELVEFLHVFIPIIPLTRNLFEAAEEFATSEVLSVLNLRTAIGSHFAIDNVFVDLPRCDVVVEDSTLMKRIRAAEQHRCVAYGLQRLIVDKLLQHDDQAEETNTKLFDSCYYAPLSDREVIKDAIAHDSDHRLYQSHAMMLMMVFLEMAKDNQDTPIETPFIVGQVRYLDLVTEKASKNITLNLMGLSVISSQVDSVSKHEDSSSSVEVTRQWSATSDIKWNLPPINIQSPVIWSRFIDDRCNRISFATLSPVLNLNGLRFKILGPGVNRELMSLSHYPIHGDIPPGVRILQTAEGWVKHVETQTPSPWPSKIAATPSYKKEFHRSINETRGPPKKMDISLDSVNVSGSPALVRLLRAISVKSKSPWFSDRALDFNDLLWLLGAMNSKVAVSRSTRKKANLCKFTYIPSVVYAMMYTTTTGDNLSDKKGVDSTSLRDADPYATTTEDDESPKKNTILRYFDQLGVAAASASGINYKDFQVMESDLGEMIEGFRDQQQFYNGNEGLIPFDELDDQVIVRDIRPVLHLSHYDRRSNQLPLMTDAVIADDEPSPSQMEQRNESPSSPAPRVNLIGSRVDRATSSSVHVVAVPVGTSKSTIKGDDRKIILQKATGNPRRTSTSVGVGVDGVFPPADYGYQGRQVSLDTKGIEPRKICAADITHHDSTEPDDQLASSSSYFADDLKMQVTVNVSDISVSIYSFGGSRKGEGRGHRPDVSELRISVHLFRSSLSFCKYGASFQLPIVKRSTIEVNLDDLLVLEHTRQGAVYGNDGIGKTDTSSMSMINAEDDFIQGQYLTRVAACRRILRLDVGGSSNSADRKSVTIHQVKVDCPSPNDDLDDATLRRYLDVFMARRVIALVPLLTLSLNSEDCANFEILHQGRNPLNAERKGDISGPNSSLGIEQRKVTKVDVALNGLVLIPTPTVVSTVTQWVGVLRTHWLIRLLSLSTKTFTSLAPKPLQDRSRPKVYHSAAIPK
eukprot:GHVH01009510.1.p1 GENE.GHVH01009510.1~~GHVH01009510.1.p1  ORF type:complete len:1705 (+),score=230.42 GHVH01009510.1:1750-6864(+)